MGNGGAGVGFASPSVGGAGAIAFNIGGPLTYSGTLNNTGGFVKSGTGQLTWSSTNNAITGTIEVAAGTLNVAGHGVCSNWHLQQQHAADLAGGLGRGLDLRDSCVGNQLPTTTSSTAAC